MTKEERMDNTYFDQNGKQILVGDLLKVFHFKTRSRVHYMYHVVVMEQSDFEVMAAKAHYANKPHYRLHVVCDNKQRVYHSAKIIGEKDFETKRQKIKVNP
jgi:hypothetical protein